MNISTLIRKRLYSQVMFAKEKAREMTGEEVKPIIDFDAIVKKLGMPDGDINDFQIDHVIPLSYWNNGSKQSIEMAFHPENLRWLHKEDNLNKRKRFNTTTEVEIFNRMEIKK